MTFTSEKSYKSSDLECFNTFIRDPSVFSEGILQGTHKCLVDSLKGRFEFPELRRIAKEQYDYWKPETVLIEAKASGLPLTYELRNMGIPVVNFTPSKGNDKHARVNAVADLFASGVVWCPETRWAEEVVEEFAAFPNAEHDDLVDSSTQALSRFRQGGFISLFSDEIDEPYDERKRAEYY